MKDQNKTGQGDEKEWTAVEKVILGRRSIRAFKKEPLPDFMIRRILEAGRFAPSAGNAQPWRFVVVKSPEIVAQMEKDAVRITKVLMWFSDYTRSRVRRTFLKPFSKLLIRLFPNELHPVPMGLMQEIARERVPVFHGAPTLILLLEDRRGASSPPTDIGICGQNMVLAAHSLGAGTCWIGMIKLIMVFKKWKDRFAVRYPYRLKVCLALGYPRFAADGQVPREIQEVQWLEGGMKDPPRVEQQGG